MKDEFDPIDGLEAEETARKLPAGWLLLFWGLIAFGVVYAALYIPSISGWSQEAEYEQSVKE